MASDAERLEILKLVEAGKITPDEAASLLTELDGESARDRPAPMAASVVAGPARWFKLRVEENGGQRVNLQLPIVAMPFLLRFAGRWAPDRYRDLFHMAADRVAQGFRGDLLSVEETNGNRVRLWVE
jgi:hypothetical protein